MLDLSNLTLEPFVNRNRSIEIGGIHYIAQQGAYFVFIGFLTESQESDKLHQIWITNRDNPYGGGLETVEQWDDWLQVYTSIAEFKKNVLVVEENTTFINPVKIQIDCNDYLEEYQAVLISKHKTRYDNAKVGGLAKKVFELEGEILKSFGTFMNGKQSRKPFIDKILESLE